jgi:hypothetical protein
MTDELALTRTSGRNGRQAWLRRTFRSVVDRVFMRPAARRNAREAAWAAELNPRLDRAIRQLDEK